MPKAIFYLLKGDYSIGGTHDEEKLLRVQGSRFGVWDLQRYV